MKKILILILLFSFISVDAQRQTKKYNSLQDRYEYYNARGQMTGYEVYNSLQEQWEYYSVKTSSSSNSYGEPVSTFDADLAIFALSAAEKNRASKRRAIERTIDANNSRFQNALGRIQSHIDNIDNTEIANEVVEIYNRRFINYKNTFEYAIVLANNQASTNKINAIIEIYNTAYEEVVNEYKTKVRESKRYVPKFKYGDYVETYSYSIIRSEPNRNSKEVGKVDNNIVKIISNFNEGFYKVESGSVFGYISANWLKNKLESKPINKPTTKVFSMGGYTADKIIEFEWDSEKKTYKKSKEIKVESKLYFKDDYYAFKRGANEWLYANWTYSGFDDKYNTHNYYDNYGQILSINIVDNNITWYMEKRDDIWTKVIMYYNLTMDNSVKPRQ